MKRFELLPLLFIVTMICLLLASCDDKPAPVTLETPYPAATVKPSPSPSPDPIASPSISRFGSSVTLLNLDDWNHPTKAAIERNYMKLLKVELTQNNKYPIFYVQFSKSSRLFNKTVIDQALKSIAEANGYWDFTLIDEDQKIQIDVACNHTDKHLLSSTINGQQDYFMEQFKATDKIWQKQPPALKELLLKLNVYGWNIKELLAERDLNQDGNKEFVVSFGDLTIDDSELDSYLISKTSQGYHSLGKVDVGNVGWIFQYKWLDLNHNGKPYLLAQRTNGTSYGFTLMHFENNQFVSLDGGFPPTGNGGASWIEAQPDGSFKKKTTQQFTDIQSHLITLEYAWDGAQFILDKSTFSYDADPEKFVYPSTPGEVVENYLADQYLKVYKDDNQVLNKELNEMLKDGFKDSKEYKKLALTGMMYYSNSLNQAKIINEDKHVVLEVHDDDRANTSSPSVFFTLDFIDEKWKIASISDTYSKK